MRICVTNLCQGHNTKRAKADASQTNSQPNSATSTSTEGGGGGNLGGDSAASSPSDFWGSVSFGGGVGGGGGGAGNMGGVSAETFRSDCTGRAYFRQQIAQRLIPVLRACVCVCVRV